MRAIMPDSTRCGISVASHGASCGKCVCEREVTGKKKGKWTGTNAKDERVGNAKVGCVPGPERVEVDRRADLPAVVHLDGLAVQLGQLDVRCCCRVRCRDL